MHAGQFKTLEEVIQHYRRAPKAAAGRSEISSQYGRGAGSLKIRPGEADVQDLAAFLRTLTGPVNQTVQ